MTEIWNFITSLFEIMWESWFLIVIIVVGGITLLYAVYRGRRGQTAKTGMPIYSAEFALGAFGFDMTRNMTKRQHAVLAGLIILLVLILVVGLWYY